MQLIEDDLQMQFYLILLIIIMLVLTEWSLYAPNVN